VVGGKLPIAYQALETEHLALAILQLDIPQWQTDQHK
jgi:hypothetical protein